VLLLFAWQSLDSHARYDHRFVPLHYIYILKALSPKLEPEARISDGFEILFCIGLRTTAVYRSVFQKNLLTVIVGIISRID